MLRRAAQAVAQEGSRERGFCGDAAPRASRARSASFSSHGTRTSACKAYATPARCFSLVRGGRIPPCGNRRDAGNDETSLEEHTFSGEKKSSPDARTATQQRRGNTVNDDECYLQRSRADF